MAASERIAVVVGDAALMSGLSLEALNDIGQRKTRMLILLNDNEMSISPTVGAVSQYLSRIKLSRSGAGRSAPGTTPWPGSRRFGPLLLEWSTALPPRGGGLLAAGASLRGPRRHLRRPRARATTWSPSIARCAWRSLEEEAPIIVHVRTRKGYGYRPAEADQVSFHGAALPPMPARRMP